MSEDSLTGFALRRNGSCLSSESECGATASPYYACCPGGSACSNPYNQVCCPPGSNCTTEVVQSPVCGDRTWNLYNNGGVDSGYFCCLSTSSGYSASLSNSNGCRDPGYELQSGEVALQLLSQALASTSASSTFTSSGTEATSASTVRESITSGINVSSSATSSSAPSTASDGSASQTSASSSGASSSGPVIGGAVAGVLVLVLLVGIGFFFYRKRSRTSGNKEQDDSHGPYGHHQSKKSDYREVMELSDSQVIELPSTEQPRIQKGQQQPVELP